MEKKPERKKFTRPSTALKQKRVLVNLSENGGNLGKAILDAGYSKSYAKTPSKIVESKTFLEVLEESMPDDELTQKHRELLNSTRVDHMTFPLGPKKNAEKKEGEDVLSDEEIKEMLEEVNCRVRRIVHGEQARHVYFWSSDNRAKKDALEMAYKLKGRYTDETKPPQGTVNYNIIFSGPVQEKVKVIDAEIKNLLTQDDQEN